MAKVAKKIEAHEAERPRVQRMPPRVVPMPLAMVRKAQELTQEQMAERTGILQSDLSKLERRGDAKLSTLRRYAEALGATCELVFVFQKTGHRIPVSMADDDD